MINQNTLILARELFIHNFKLISLILFLEFVLNMKKRTFGKFCLNNTK